MSFSESGGVITQIGTDADLSGLVGVAGVTVTSDDNFTVYTIAGKKLDIDGTLSIDPEAEEILFDETCPHTQLTVSFGGTLNLGRQITGTGITDLDLVTRGYGVRSAAASASFGHFHVYIDGILNVYGGGFQTGGTIRFTWRSEVNGKRLRTLQPRGDNNARLQFDTGSDFDLVGHDAIGGTGWALGNPRYPDNGYAGYNPEGCLFTIHGEYDLVVRDYEGQGRNQYDAYPWGEVYWQFINPRLGSAPFNFNYGNGDQEFIEFKKEISVTARDSATQAALPIRVYVPDYDDGNRHNVTVDAVLRNAEDDSPIVNTSDSTTIDETVRISTLTVDGTNYGMSYRSKNGDNTDLYDVTIFSEGYIPKKLLNVELKGIGRKSVSAELDADSVWSAASSSSALAVTGISVDYGTTPVTITVDQATASGGSITEAELYNFIRATEQANPSESLIVQSADSVSVTYNANLKIKGTSGVIITGEKTHTITGQYTTRNAADDADNPLVSTAFSVTDADETIAITLVVQGLVSGSKVYIDSTSYNVTGTGVSIKSLSPNTSYEIRIAHPSKKPIKSTISLEEDTLVQSFSQQDYDVSLTEDGSAVTSFAINGSTLEVTDTDNVFNVREFVAWARHNDFTNPENTWFGKVTMPIVNEAVIDKFMPLIENTKAQDCNVIEGSVTKTNEGQIWDTGFTFNDSWSQTDI